MGSPTIPVLGSTGTIDLIGSTVFAVGAVLVLIAAIPVRHKMSAAALAADA